MTFEINPPAPEKAPVGLGHPSKSLSPRMNGSSETPKAENGSPKAVEGVEGELRAIRNSILEVNYNQVHLTQGLAKVIQRCHHEDSVSAAPGVWTRGQAGQSGEEAGGCH